MKYFMIWLSILLLFLNSPFGRVFPLEERTKLEIAFPNLEGKIVTLTDEQFKSKIILIDILGYMVCSLSGHDALLERNLRKIPRSEG